MVSRQAQHAKALSGVDAPADDWTKYIHYTDETGLQNVRLAQDSGKTYVIVTADITSHTQLLSGGAPVSDQQTVVESVTGFQCNHCDRSYRSADRLNNHMKRTHYRREQGHTCPVCNRTYRTKRDIARHMLTHTGQL